MSDNAKPGIESKRRRLLGWEIATFAFVIIAIALRNAFSDLTEYAWLGHPLSTWEPFIWEFSSCLVVAALVPGIAWLRRRFPLVAPRWYRTLPIHLLATLPFSIIHVSGMVGLRKIAYAVAGSRYDFGPVLAGWLYEYRKDIVAYTIIVFFLEAFDFYRRTHLATDDTPPQAAVDPPASEPNKLDRLIVRRHNREFILDVGDIARIASDGNYVAIHANGETYRLRGSLTGLARRLDERRFVRIHRGQLVNLDHVREIQPWDHGDYRVLLHDGSVVNFSRRYRARLDHLLDASKHPHTGNPARHWLAPFITFRLGSAVSSANVI